MRQKVLLVYVLHIADLTITAASTETRLNDNQRDNRIPNQLRNINYVLMCRLQPNGYHCANGYTNAKFYYDTNMETCMTFNYAECEFSPNQFNTLTECNSKCIDAVLRNSIDLENLTMDVVCRLQPDSGTCTKYHPRYYFDISTRSCKGFAYTGCGGNLNRFKSELDCKALCIGAVPIPSRI